jgi:hypothetical protein
MMLQLLKRPHQRSGQERSFSEALKAAGGVSIESA